MRNRVLMQQNKKKPEGVPEHNTEVHERNSWGERENETLTSCSNCIGVHSQVSLLGPVVCFWDIEECRWSENHVLMFKKSFWSLRMTSYFNILLQKSRHTLSFLLFSSCIKNKTDTFLMILLQDVQWTVMLVVGHRASSHRIWHHIQRAKITSCVHISADRSKTEVMSAVCARASGKMSARAAGFSHGALISSFPTWLSERHKQTNKYKQTNKQTNVCIKAVTSEERLLRFQKRV